MRTREELLENPATVWGVEFYYQKRILEVLLDIRGLLTQQDNPDYRKDMPAKAKMFIKNDN